MTQLQELDIVALTEDRQTTHFETGESIILLVMRLCRLFKGVKL
ncbi:MULTISPECIES: hypothetical protein [unclassified Okeania]|nr:MULTISPECIES: hypothetical protein [unclassified Okeania]